MVETLEKFMDLANETKGASFSISRNKSKIYIIHLVNQGQTFKNKNLWIALGEASDWIVENRKPTEVIQVKYEL